MRQCVTGEYSGIIIDFINYCNLIFLFAVLYFNKFSMFKVRKLRIDSDNEQLPANLFTSELQDTPQTLTFGTARINQFQPNNNTFNESSIESKRYLSTKLKSSSCLNRNHSSEKKLTQVSNRSSKKRLSRVSFRTSTYDGPQRDATISKQFDQIQKTVQQKKIRDCRLIFQKNNILEGIIKTQKIKNLQNNFIKKVSRTSTVASPVEYYIRQQEDQNILNMNGIELSPLMENILSLLSVIQIITLLVIYTISIVFEDLITNNSYLATLQGASLIFYFLEISLSLVSIKSEAGKKITVIKEIIMFYFSRSFCIDILSFFILLIDISTSNTVISFLRLVIIFKLPQCLNKIQKLQVYFIRNIYNQQYWELAKVFLVNFCIAHIFALFLAAMAKINPHQNWMTVRGISNAAWLQKYVWSYYWAVNIMLTVGFGDIVASNSAQAVCLIFIETFSCIVMAYNINCMGGIITNIRSQNDKRNKKFKIFKKLADQNFVPEELEFKINNYIEEASNLKKKFNYEEDQEFINELPETLKTTYLRQANKTVLKKLVFFRDLLDKTLYNFAQHLQTRISHPQEIIRSIDDDFNLIILKKGEIGYICKRNGCSFNDEIADLIKVGKGQAPFLTSLDFMSKQRPLYQIKSLTFSVLFRLDYNRFVEIFKQSDMDYQLFCFIRDKIRNIPDQFQVLPCQFCNKKFNHFKFTCPKLHYAPYEQHIINKEIYKEKVGKNQRRKIKRIKNGLFSPVQYFKKLKDLQYSQQISKQGSNQCFPSNTNIKRSLPFKQRLAYASSQMFQNQTVDKFPGMQLTGQYFQFLIDTKAKEIIEMEFLKREKKLQFDDEIWILNLDTLSDYNSYFSQHNPSILKQRFNPDVRMQRKIQKIQNHQTLRSQNFIKSGDVDNLDKKINQLSI